MIATNTMTFGERLQELRERKRLSQSQLAKASGVKVGSIRNYEQGLRRPHWDAFVLIATALEVDLEAFADCDEVKREDEKPAPKRTRKRKAD